MKKFNYLLIALILLTGKSIFSKSIKEMWGKDTAVTVDEDLNEDGSVDIKISVAKEFVDDKGITRTSVNSKQIYKDAKNIRLVKSFLWKNWALMAETVGLQLLVYSPDERGCGKWTREFKFNEGLAEVSASKEPLFSTIFGPIELSEEESKLCKELKDIAKS